MLIGKVTGNIWATRKLDGLNGFKLMIVSLVNSDGADSKSAMVAVDTVGAGIGDMVLVARGGAARKAAMIHEGPVDAAIVGIVDNMEISG
ncbi:EutN/CcmL family microcompartment protein [Kistimonas scapharcae]|uniref:EutN/CcmL family microcompartment protein n=1 Tax=Kistimonas scapharcae TaxID=1036133 RepID=A0ABP8V0V9_9GAMM